MTGSQLALSATTDGRVYRASSALRFKDAVAPLEVDPDTVLRLQPRSFSWKEGNGDRAHGLIADEVAEVAPELVVNDSEGAPLDVSDRALTAALVAQLQRQAQRIEELERQMETL